MIPRIAFCSLATWLSLAAIVYATQPAVETRASGVHVSVDEINDKRTTGTFFAECEVELKVMGDAVADSLGIRVIRVLTVVDDTGHQLKLDKEESRTFFSQNSKKESVLKEKVKLRNPSRSASVIRTFQGEIELFHPTPENGGQIVVKGFMGKPGEPIEAPVLKAQSVQVMYVTKEILEAKKQEFRDETKRAEQHLQQAGQEIGEGFADLFSGMFVGMSETGHNLQFLIEDPEERVVDLEFLDASGKPLKVTSRSSIGQLRRYSFEQMPPADIQLVIYLATPDSITTVPFTLQDIPLP